MNENNNKVTAPPEPTEAGLQHAGRRRFLKVLTAGSAVAGIAAVSSTQVLAGSPETTAKAAPETGNGYRETDHIRSFYDTLR